MITVKTRTHHWSAEILDMDRLALAVVGAQQTGSRAATSLGQDGLVGTAGAIHAIEALGRAIGSKVPSVRISGPPGVGKSLILTHFFNAMRSPWVKVAIVSGNLGEIGVLDRLVHVICGVSSPSVVASEPLWVLLGRRLQAAKLQGQTIMLGIDDANALSGTMVLARLKALAGQTSTQATVVEVLTTECDRYNDGDPEDWNDPAFAIRLKPLTRTEAELYLRSKHLPPVNATHFTDDAITAIHSLSRGLPRRMDRFVTSALVLAKKRSRQTIDRDLVHDVHGFDDF